ncbi:hypothetical protein M758_9G042000 [Ceratodon purpureus]|nr:hypothetical protein M758_9G042000 [Ceratodon purpureus]
MRDRQARHTETCAETSNLNAAKMTTTVNPFIAAKQLRMDVTRSGIQTSAIRLAYPQDLSLHRNMAGIVEQVLTPTKLRNNKMRGIGKGFPKGNGHRQTFGHPQILYN